MKKNMGCLDFRRREPQDRPLYRLQKMNEGMVPRYFRLFENRLCNDTVEILTVLPPFFNSTNCKSVIILNYACNVKNKVAWGH